MTDENKESLNEPSSPTSGSTSVTDLVIVVGLVAIGYTISILLEFESSVFLTPIVAKFFAIIQVVLGLFTVLFALGYVTLALITPRLISAGGLDWEEKVVISFLVSVVLVVFQGLLLDISGLGFQPTFVVQSMTLLVVIAAIVAGCRRVFHTGLPPKIGTESLHSVVERIRKPPTQMDTILNLLLVVLLLVSAGVVLSPSIGEETPRFTEFGILTENTDGELVTADDPAALLSNESDPLIVSITNQEQATHQYTLVVQIERAFVSERSIQILDRRQVDRNEMMLSHNETESVSYSFQPTNIRQPILISDNGTEFVPSRSSTGNSGCRVVFLLYIDEVPDSPTVENANYHLHIWDGQPPSTREEACPSTAALELVNN